MQPCSTSMPNTCSSESTTCTHNIIYFLQQDEYREFLKEIIEKSLSSIQQHFYGGCEPTQIHTLRARLSKSTHIQNLAVFFLLLIVDADLKNTIMDMEVTNNHAKLTRSCSTSATSAYLFFSQTKRRQWLTLWISAWITI